MYLTGRAVSSIAWRGWWWGARESARRILQGDCINALHSPEAVNLKGKLKVHAKNNKANYYNFTV